MKRGITRLLAVLSLLAMVIPALGVGPSVAQGDSRLFPETGKTVKGRFLTYWNGHGALPQQGFPISEEMEEVSDTDGKTYTVQYFERAVFEYHPDEKPEFQVLLSLLGAFSYQARYGSAGAPNQTPNAEPNSVLVPETGKHLGGIFLDYWKSHGALAQQGYPISEEFNEVSDLNGQTYKVQYFQRAVFEFHPEEKPEFQVLLSQLGTFQYRKKYLQPTPTPVPPTATAAPTSTAVPTSPPAPTAATGCDISDDRNGGAIPADVRAGGITTFIARGFRQGEAVSFWFTLPNGNVFGTAAPVPNGAGPGGVLIIPFDVPTEFGANPGRWALTFQGASSGNVAIIHFCVRP
jgi:hypothetical protein